MRHITNWLNYGTLEMMITLYQLHSICQISIMAFQGLLFTRHNNKNSFALTMQTKSKPQHNIYVTALQCKIFAILTFYYDNIWCEYDFPDLFTRPYLAVFVRNCGAQYGVPDHEDKVERLRVFPDTLQVFLTLHHTIQKRRQF